MIIFCMKNADLTKIKELFVLKGLCPETTFVCVLSYQILSFKNNSNEF